MNRPLMVIDNYDSFTYNLVQYLGELGAEVIVRRNDAVTIDEVAAARPRAVVISPGPGTPDQAGICTDLIRSLGPALPIMGVCLGHQCIGQAYGAKVTRAARIMHGKVSPVFHQGRSLFRGLPSPLEATRYHSLIVERETLPGALELTAWTEDGTIMGLRHVEHPVTGVQFHPESILTSSGRRLLANFLDDADAWQKGAGRC
ncbi:MAG: aminodeoxychorismate/anthranilate synthase component II [Chloroflexi bacterium]|nr:MAG: aminodeoxychorismate/anthranilate synthase component II [Chloroflexota bacterium]